MLEADSSGCDQLDRGKMKQRLAGLAKPGPRNRLLLVRGSKEAAEGRRLEEDR